MLNPGTMLKALTEGNINLELHGHDHQRTIARYGTVYGRGSEIVVVGAGSANLSSAQGDEFLPAVRKAWLILAFDRMGGMSSDDAAQ